jgi:Zn-dependent oligopeptidase
MRAYVRKNPNMSKPLNAEQKRMLSDEYETLHLSTAALAQKHRLPINRVKLALKELGTRMRSFSQAATTRTRLH